MGDDLGPVSRAWIRARRVLRTVGPLHFLLAAVVVAVASYLADLPPVAEAVAFGAALFLALLAFQHRGDRYPASDDW